MHRRPVTTDATPNRPTVGSSALPRSATALPTKGDRVAPSSTGLPSHVTTGAAPTASTASASLAPNQLISRGMPASQNLQATSAPPVTDDHLREVEADQRELDAERQRRAAADHSAATLAANSVILGEVLDDEEKKTLPIAKKSLPIEPVVTAPVSRGSPTTAAPATAAVTRTILLDLPSVNDYNDPATGTTIEKNRMVLWNGHKCLVLHSGGGNKAGRSCANPCIRVLRLDTKTEHSPRKNSLVLLPLTAAC